jgi:hypothetical protein
MTESTYDVLARILRDNDEESHRSKCALRVGDERLAGYCDGLDAATARIRAALFGVPRSAQPEWRGKPPGPLDGGGGGGGGGDDPGPPPTKPDDGGGGRVIEADYTIVDPFSGKKIVAGQIEP